MEQRHNTHIHQHKLSRAWNGDSILALPVDRLLLSRGVYATYDGAKYRPPPRVARPGDNQRPPQEKGDSSKDTHVVLEALQRILRGKEDAPNRPFAEFGQARPIR